tara:strand:+ start:296 stop:511 length:216 start_codon:yes stop_codon:yes gene_type:complete
LEQRGDLDGSFEEPAIKEKEKVIINKGRRPAKSKGRSKSKGKQEVGLKLGKQQSHTRNQTAGNGFNVNTGT